MDVSQLPEPLRAPVSRWWERAGADARFMAGYSAPTAQKLRAELPRVVAASEFCAAALLQDPEAMSWLVAIEAAAAESADYARFEHSLQASASASPAQAQSALRRWRRREMLRIAWRDIAARADTLETLRATSDLADCCIRAAVAAAREQLLVPFGVARDTANEEIPFIVLGMGKLGGRELNFSSDVDLIFLFESRGQTDGVQPLDSDEYFTRLGREIIRLLDARTEEGFVFRVDMRLRPFGQSGPLAVSLSSLEDYLQQHGRDWERYAWIKARPIVGAVAYAKAYEEFVRSFVYRRYLDFGVFDSLRDMKALIAREVSRHDLDQHLKLGAGGIREIEFIVQSLQLVRGGSDRHLQNPQLLEVMPRLAGSRSLSARDLDELRSAYLTLRRAENGVQMIRDEQTHLLPRDPLDQERLRVNMGAASWADTLERIDVVRTRVAQQFGRLIFGEQGQERRSGAPILSWLASEELDIRDELPTRGFTPADVGPVADALDAYRHAAPLRRLDELGRRRVSVILDHLLNESADRAMPAVVVQRVLRVLEAIGARSSYLALLNEEMPALDRLIDVCAISGFLARQIAEFPLLLDELIDAKAFDELPSREAFVQELTARTERLPLQDEERQVEGLRQFQKAAVFTVALADMTERLPLMRVSDRLTDIAELIVQRCTALAWTQMTRSHGEPRCVVGGVERGVSVAVIGYGKLGGFELGYGSDLDLVFLHDSTGERQQTSGEKSVDNGLFLARLGQRIVHLITMHSAGGRLYEVDMRLRPNGNSGVLVTAIDTFERYQQNDAWTWEHQALLRARAVGGEASLCARFEALRRTTLCHAVSLETLRTDVKDMRVRMRRELSRARVGMFDIKQDAGGIADIEFLVQYWVLAAAPAHAQLVTFSDNIRQLEGLARLGVIENDVAQWLTDAYIRYRTDLHHASLEGQSDRVFDAAPYADMRASVSAIWHNVFDSASSTP